MKTAARDPLADVDLDKVSAFAHQIVARGLMRASSPEIEGFFRLVRAASTIPALIAELRAARAVAEEALDWCMPFGAKHMPPNSSSELLPTKTRVAGVDRDVRLAELRGLISSQLVER